MRRATSCGFALTLGVRSALAALYTDPSQLNKTYDYVVVGSGPGGSVVANRLSEDSNVNVLIIEAGGNPDGNVLAEAPWLAPGDLSTTNDWNFTTTPQSGLDGRSFAYNRGKALGGSSTLNFMVWDRGSRDDYDRWANVTGDDGWGWDKLEPYMRKAEGLHAPQDGHDLSGQLNVSAHGTDGPLGITVGGYSLPTDARVINASKEIGGQFGFNLDMSTGNTIGTGWSPVAQRDGARSSGWTSYIKPYLNRTNFDVLIDHQVTKVLQTGQEKGVPVFRGVQFAQNSSAPTQNLNVTKEVILSAGSAMSPQILLLSGIGPKDGLSALNIPVVVQNEAVGKNMQDHALITNVYSVKDGMFTLDPVSQNATFAANAIADWNSTRKNELVLNACNQVGWHRVNDSLLEGKDPSAGPTSGHYELIYTDAFVSFTNAMTQPATGGYFTVFTNVVSPASRGSLTLNSTSPWVQPLVNPGILADPLDLVIMREAIKAGAAMANASSFKDFLVEPIGPYAEALAKGDAGIEAYAKNLTTTVWHITSSLSMTSEKSTDGALNPDLTVKGTVGLRVVDASAFPFIPAAHTQAPTYILAERAADIIKGVSKTGTNSSSSASQSSSATRVGSPLFSALLSLRHLF
ncbi:GMC oxidoreductase [Peniophora sp. CONT]|nr:GMC oxidoreductase [Peniophora sp. CONT]